MRRFDLLWIENRNSKFSLNEKIYQNKTDES